MNREEKSLIILWPMDACMNLLHVKYFVSSSLWVSEVPSSLFRRLSIVMN